MSSPSRDSRGWSWLGRILALTGVVWVLWQIFAEGWSPPGGLNGRRMVPAIVLGALAYALLSLLLAVAWWWLTDIYGGRRPLLPTVAVWARTQIAKYLPGNVFHYLGRQALGRRLGLVHQALVASHILEVGGLIAAAALIGIGGAAVTRFQAPASVSLPLIAVTAVGGLLAWPLIDATFRRLPFTAGAMAALPQLSVRGFLRLMLPAFAAHAVFLIGSGLLLFALLRVGASTSTDVVMPDLPWAQVLWVYALAWVAGIVTPGAPGGLGVREAVLALGLGNTLGASNAAAAALALRLVTLLGDALTFGLGWLIPSIDRHGTRQLILEKGPETDG